MDAPEAPCNEPAESEYKCSDIGLTCVSLLVALALGYLLPLHLLSAISLVFDVKSINPLTVSVSSCIGLILAGYLFIDRVKTAYKCTLREPLPTLVGLKWAVLVALIPYLVFLIESLLSFPSGYDAIAYHIDVAQKWLQNGTTHIDTTWGWKYSLPGNAELPALFALAIGIPNAVAVGNLFAVVLLAGSVYLIAWYLTSGSVPSMLASLAAVTIPMVIYQSFQLYVDMFGTAFLVAAAALLLAGGTSSGTFHFLAGCSLGVATGTKPVFWVYCALFVAIAFSALLKTRRRPTRIIALFVLGVLLSSGMWFFRALWETGNPIFPMAVSIGDVEVLPGYKKEDITPISYGLESFIEALGQPWTEVAEDDGFPVGNDRGTGMLFASVVLPGVLFSLVRVITRRSGNAEMFLLISVLVGFCLWSIVLLRVPRFLLPVLVISCAIAAPMLHMAMSKRNRLIVAVYAVGITFNALVVSVEPVHRTLARIRLGDFSRASYYGYPPVIDTFPLGTRVVDETERERFMFALSGDKMTNYVVPSRVNIEGSRYIVREGAIGELDARPLPAGARLIYEGVPSFMYPKLSRQWQIYKVE